MRLESNEADHRRGAFAHRHAHTVRLGHRAASLDRAYAHRDAVAARTLLAGFDEAGNRRALTWLHQDRVGNVLGGDRGGGKAGSDGGKTERERKAEWAMARDDRNRHADERQRRNRPPSRLALSGEVQDDAEAESDRQPGREAVRRRRRSARLCYVSQLYGSENGREPFALAHRKECPRMPRQKSSGRRPWPA
jgi:hypothetical protein